jgi:hypothetical protein
MELRGIVQNAAIVLASGQALPEGANLQEGIRLYSQRPDKERSLTHCISFVVIEGEGTTEA